MHSGKWMQEALSVSARILLEWLQTAAEASLSIFLVFMQFEVRPHFALVSVDGLSEMWSSRIHL